MVEAFEYSPDCFTRFTIVYTVSLKQLTENKFAVPTLSYMNRLPGKTSKKKPVVAPMHTKATEPTLRHLAFDHSLQPNVITTVSSGKIILANKAACKLLGYTKKEILTRTRSTIFNINDDSFIEMMQQRTAEGHSKGLVHAIRKNGKELCCEITSAVFADTDGIENAITTIVDMTERIQVQKDIDTNNIRIVEENISLAISLQKKTDLRKEKQVQKDILLAKQKAAMEQAENSAWKKHIGKASFDVMWDWDLSSGEVYVSDSVEELFGYKVKGNMIRFVDFAHQLIPEERDGVEKRIWKALNSKRKTWKDNYFIRRRDRTLAATSSRATIVRNEKGMALHVIGATEDVSRMKELEEKLNNAIINNANQGKEFKENFKLIINSSSDVLYDIDLIANEVIISDAYEKEYGYPINSKMTPAQVWQDHIHTDDREALTKDFFRMLASDKAEWKYNCRYIKADGTVANILGSSIVLRNSAGIAYRMIGAMHDISKETVLEERLAVEISLKERQIADATKEAEETARTSIGRELHDNVNQLLGASRLYLEMAKRGGENSEMYISRSSGYTLSAIEEIRKLTKELTSDSITNLGLCESIENLSRDTMEVSPIKITSMMETFMEGSVSDKFKINIYRIVQEQLNNILKHADAQNVLITLSQKMDSITIAVTDDGVGFDPRTKKEGIGMANIKSRAITYNGKADFVSQKGEGCRLVVIFPFNG